eukprot:589923-Amorphochlora_amoeboformis.AAC.1
MLAEELESSRDIHRDIPSGIDEKDEKKKTEEVAKPDYGKSGKLEKAKLVDPPTQAYGARECRNPKPAMENLRFQGRRDYKWASRTPFNYPVPFHTP